MRLLYCYAGYTDRDGTPRPLRGMKELELSFSPRDVYRFDAASDTLRRFDRETPLPARFWANGRAETNIRNINVIAGKNGAGKSTAIHYLMDLLNYVYHGFGETLSDQERHLRHDPSRYRNLLLFEKEGDLFALDLRCGQADGQLRTEGFPESPRFLGRQEAQALLRSLKVINLSNTMTRRDYELHLGRQDEWLRNDFIYDCTIGAAVSGGVGQFFPYEVYKQISYLFDHKQYQARRELEETIPELRLPRALRLRLLWDRFEEPLESLTGTRAVGADSASWQQAPLPVQLAALCAVSCVENLRGTIKRDIYAYPRLPQLPDCTADSGALREALLAFLDRAETWFRTLLIGKIVSGSSDGTLRVWDADTGKCLRVLNGHTAHICCVTVLPDGRVVSGSFDRTLRVWDADTGECLQTLEGHSDCVRCVATLRDGRVISGSDDCTLRVWDADTGECLQTLEGHKRWVVCVAVLRDGRVVSGFGDGALWVLDADTGECLQTLEGNAGPITCVAVLPDGRIISGSADRTLRVWDADLGKVLKILKGHTGTIYSVAVLPDGRVVSGSSDRTLRVWDADTGKCLQTLEGHTGSVVCAAALLSVGKDTEPILRLIRERTERCRAYINHVLEDPDGLFSRFQPADSDLNAYELPIPQERGEESPLAERDRESELVERGLVNFLEKYHRICTPYYTLEFGWGLSSGEENLLRLFSWLFHIFPRGADGGDRRYLIRNGPDTDGGDACDSVLLIMDEADLTFHPEWQRRLIHILTAFLPAIYPPDCVKDLQLILTTHSPLLLGDVPRENIRFLFRPEDGGSEEDGGQTETFGQNIHTILKDSFFLDHGTVGQFAANKIDGLARQLRTLQRSKRASRLSAAEQETIRQTIALVAPGVLRAKLEQLLREAEQSQERLLREAEQKQPDVKMIAAQTSRLSEEDRQWLLRHLQKETKP